MTHSIRLLLCSCLPLCIQTAQTYNLRKHHSKRRLDITSSSCQKFHKLFFCIILFKGSCKLPLSCLGNTGLSVNLFIFALVSSDCPLNSSHSAALEGNAKTSVQPLSDAQNFEISTYTENGCMTSTLKRFNHLRRDEGRHGTPMLNSKLSA